MGWPDYQAVIAPLASGTALRVGKIQKLELLGYEGQLQWTQNELGLNIFMPAKKPSEYAVAFKIFGA